MSMRIRNLGRIIGRIEDYEVKIILPLIVKKIIHVDFYYLEVPERLVKFTKMRLKANVYLLSTGVSEPIL